MIKKSAFGTSSVLWLLLFLMALLCYATGLDSLYLPSNGDEMVYSRIARLTAESGHWLPLVSDLNGMRNTKPPLLFWQAVAMGNGGQHWDLWRLRSPAVAYSLLIAVGTGLIAARMSGKPVDAINGKTPQRNATVIGLTAACVYLTFFSSFRYGRPYLTSAAETFWLCLPTALVLWRAPRASTPARLPGWRVFVVFGLLWGVGLLYKSFALVLPTAAGLGCVLLALQVTAGRVAGLKTALHVTLHIALRITLRTALSGLVAIAVFALWFAFDPDPGAVWKEFVLGENVGKLATTTQSLSFKAIAITVQALAWAENAGPLAFVVFGLMALGLGHTLRAVRGAVMRWPALRPSDHHTGERSAGNSDATQDHRAQIALAAWALVWLVVFCLPSQRSARYVIPAMPAIAVLVALNWQRLPRAWFVASLLLCTPVLLLLGRIAQAEHGMGISSDGEWALAAVLLAAGLALIVCGLTRPRWTRACTVAMGIALYGLLNATLAPLSGPAGHFVQSAVTLPVAASIAVPSGFNAQHERYQFLLPQALQLKTVPYPATRDRAQLPALLASHDAVIWQGGTDDGIPACANADASPPARISALHCSVLTHRWDIRSRHQSGEIRINNLWYPEQWLFGHEWLLARSTGP